LAGIISVIANLLGVKLVQAVNLEGERGKF